MTEDRFRIDVESFYNLEKMLQSPDIESQVLAFTCIEQAEWRTSGLYIIMLKQKYGMVDNWKKHAPSKCRLIELAGYELHLIYNIKDMFIMLEKFKFPAGPTQILEQWLIIQILTGRTSLHSLGFKDSMIKRLNIKLTIER